MPEFKSFRAGAQPERGDPERAAADMRALIGSVPDGILMQTGDGCITHVNPALLDLFGWDARPESLVGIECDIAIDQAKHSFDDPEAFAEGMKAILATRKPVLSRELRMKDGRTIEQDYVPVEADGVFIGHLCQFRDISERKSVEAALRESEARYKDLVEHASDIIYRANADGRFIYANPIALRILRYPEDEIIGMSYLELVRPDHRRRVQRRYLRQISNRQETTYSEFPARTRDGETVWIGQHVQLIQEDGRISGFQAVARDITERVHAVDALRTSEERTRKVVESALDAVISIDAAGKIIEFNPAAEEIFGYERADILGRHLHEHIIPSSYRTAHLEGMRHFHATGLGPVLGRRIEIEAQRADGTQFPIELAVTPIGSGPNVTFTAYVRDISGPKENLEALVAARREAERAARARERFLANMSHEMRTPLNAILGMTHLLHDCQTGPQRERYLESIKYSADNLLALINDLLDITKIKAGKIVFEQIPYDLHRLLSHIVDVVESRANEKKLVLEQHVDADVPAFIVGDPTRLNQILLNLLSNAIKFTDRGSVALRVHVGTTSRLSNELVFAVSDSGIGIPSDKHESIFDSFEQARSDTTRKYGGTGLGLSIVKELVERQGGNVVLESERGKGSTFTVRLPFEQATSLPSESAPDLFDEQGLAERHILVVEDNELNQEVAVRLLESWGAIPAVAENGLVALQRLRERSFDAVLMDIQMPVMDGVEATTRIRSELGLSGADLPILALTASVLQERRADLMALGVDDFILKPFEPTDLHLRLTAAIRRRVQPGRTRKDRQDTPHHAPATMESGARIDTTSSSLERAGQFDSSVGPASPHADPVHVDLSLFERSAMGDGAFVVRMIDILLKQLPHYVDDIEAAVHSNDLARARSLAHKMRASAGSIGLAPLIQMLLDIEEADADVNPKDFDGLLARMQAIVSAAVTDLRTRRIDFANDGLS